MIPPRSLFGNSDKNKEWQKLPLSNYWPSSKKHLSSDTQVFTQARLLLAKVYLLILKHLYKRAIFLLFKQEKNFLP